MGKGKLHELLAVEADLEGRAKVIITETQKVFKDKPAIFIGALRTYKPFEDDGVTYPEERQELTTTVDDKLQYAQKSIASWFDALLQKEATNQVASADLSVDGVQIAKDVPATFLLGLETRLKNLRNMYAVIPTLAVGTAWDKDDVKGKGIFICKYPEETFKTKKTMKSEILVQPTEFHPAQIEKWEESENVGKYTKLMWSGMVTPARKSEILDRVDSLIRAVKKARQRANSTDVQSVAIGGAIMSFINK